MAKDWNDGRQQKGKAPYSILGNDKRTKGRHLKNITKADKLYILAHGRVTGPTYAIGVQRGKYVEDNSLQGYTVKGGEWKVYSSHELAKNLEKEGLPKDFVDLRLFCCRSGGGATTPDGTAIAPYAHHLKAALMALNYNAIKVTGYLGDLTPKYDERLLSGKSLPPKPQFEPMKRKGVTRPEDQYLTRAKNARVQF